MLISAWPARADETADVQHLYTTGQTVQAMERADAYLAAHPKDAPLRFLKGVMLADAKRDAEAIAQFDKLSQDYPDLAEPYNNLAALYAARGDYARALASLEQALRNNPGYAIAQENLGDVYAALATQAYARALKLDPNSPSVPAKLGVVRQLNKAPGTSASIAGRGPAEAAGRGSASSPPTKGPPP